MKRYFVILASAVLALAACSKGLETVSPKAELVPMTFNVVNGDPETELTLSGTSLSWKSGDAISIIDAQITSAETADFHNQKFTTASAGSAVSFTGSAAEVSEYYAISPFMYTQRVNNSGSTDADFCSISTLQDGKLLIMFPYKQYGYKDNVDPAAVIMAGHSSSTDMQLKHVGGLLKFTLSGSDDITEIEIQGNNGELVCGPAYVEFDSSDNPVIATGVSTATQGFFKELGYKHLTYLPSSGSTFQQGTYYIALPALSFTNGITMTFKKANGTWAWKKGSSDLSLGRAQIVDLGTIDVSALTFKNVLDISFIQYPRHTNWALPFTTKKTKEPQYFTTKFSITSWPNTTTRSKWTEANNTAWPNAGACDLSLNTAPSWFLGTCTFIVYWDTYVCAHSNIGLRLGDNTYVQLPAVSGMTLKEVTYLSGEKNTVAVVVTDSEGNPVTGGESASMTNFTEHTFTLTDSQVNTAYKLTPTNGSKHQTAVRRIIAVYE